MTSSGPDSLAVGTAIFIDSTVFIYHFTGKSDACTRLLERCELGELKGVTSVTVLAEVSHRLMMVEAVSRGLVSPGNLVRKLREKPEIVADLSLYQQQVDRIPLMGVEIAPVDLRVWLESASYRRQHGLMTNDSLVAASAALQNVSCLASDDRDFERVDSLEVFIPKDE